jgi:hypothetical protein
MIGKCNILVATVLTALPTDKAAGTINTLTAKCINAINIIITNFFMI